jgi:hypothetical protein
MWFLALVEFAIFFMALVVSLGLLIAISIAAGLIRIERIPGRRKVLKLIRLLSLTLLLSTLFPPELPRFTQRELAETMGYVYRMTR